MELPTQTKLFKFYKVLIIFSNFPFKQFLPSGSIFVFLKEADIMLKKCDGKQYTDIHTSNTTLREYGSTNCRQIVMAITVPI